MKRYSYTCRHLLAEGEVGGKDRVEHFCSFLLYSEIQSQQASGNFLCSSLYILSLYLPGRSYYCEVMRSGKDPLAHSFIQLFKKLTEGLPLPTLRPLMS